MSLGIFGGGAFFEISHVGKIYRRMFGVFTEER